MTIDTFLAWKLTSLAGYISHLSGRVREMTADDARSGTTDNARMITRHKATLRVLEGERDILRHVSASRHNDTPLDAVTMIWWQWVQATVPTYGNNPRIYAAENDSIRQQATRNRDTALAELERMAA